MPALRGQVVAGLSPGPTELADGLALLLERLSRTTARLAPIIWVPRSPGRRSGDSAREKLSELAEIARNNTLFAAPQRLLARITGMNEDNASHWIALDGAAN